MKLQRSLLFSQEPVTALYPEPDESSLHPPILLLPDVSILCTNLPSGFLPQGLLQKPCKQFHSFSFMTKVPHISTTLIW